MAERLFKKGDKVIPISKSVGKKRTLCPFFKRFDAGEVPFLIITGTDTSAGRYSYFVSSNTGGGNEYLETDLVPFAPDENEMFTLLVQGKVNEAQYEAWKGVEQRG